VENADPSQGRDAMTPVLLAVSLHDSARKAPLQGRTVRTLDDCTL